MHLTVITPPRLALLGARHWAPLFMLLPHNTFIQFRIDMRVQPPFQHPTNCRVDFHEEPKKCQPCKTIRKNYH